MSTPNCAEPGCALGGEFVCFDGPFMPVDLCARGAARLLDFVEREFEPAGRRHWEGWYWAARLWLAGVPDRAQVELSLPMNRAGGER